MVNLLPANHWTFALLAIWDSTGFSFDAAHAVHDVAWWSLHVIGCCGVRVSMHFFCLYRWLCHLLFGQFLWSKYQGGNELPVGSWIVIAGIGRWVCQTPTHIVMIYYFTSCSVIARAVDCWSITARYYPYQCYFFFWGGATVRCLSPGGNDRNWWHGMILMDISCVILHHTYVYIACSVNWLMHLTRSS